MANDKLHGSNFNSLEGEFSVYSIVVFPWMLDLGQVVRLHRSSDLLKGMTEDVGVKGRWNLLSEELLFQRQERVVRRLLQMDMPLRPVFS